MIVEQKHLKSIFDYKYSYLVYVDMFRDLKVSNVLELDEVLKKTVITRILFKNLNVDYFFLDKRFEDFILNIRFQLFTTDSRKLDNNGLLLINSNDKINNKDIEQFILSKGTLAVRSMLIKRDMDLKITENIDLSDSNYLFRPKHV